MRKGERTELITMQELAELAGVTQSTVSRALSNHPRISDQTRSKIVGLAQKHGYRPSPGLRALSDRRWAGKRQPSTIALAHLIHRSDSQAPIRQTFRRHLQGHAAQLGYKLLEFHFEDYPNISRLSEILYSRGIQGLIVNAPRNAEELEGIRWEWFSPVCAEFADYRPPIHLVTTNSRSGVIHAWNEAQRRGAKRVAVHLMGPSFSEYYTEQHGQVLHLQNLLENPKDVIPMRLDSVYNGTDSEGFLRWIEEQAPDCLMSYTDDAYRLLVEAGYRVPEDIAFVGLRKRNAKNTTNWTHPRIAGLELDIDLHARLVVDQVDRMIRRNETGLPAEQIQHLFDRTWVEAPSFPRRIGNRLTKAH